jgi:hypothetical protein
MYKKWNIQVLLIFIMLMGLVGLINFVVDPLWCFDRKNSFNAFQDPFDERQQKTNLITFRGLQAEGIIIGSSRSTFINQNDFDYKAFNYAVSSMMPSEYVQYVEYAKGRNGGEFKYIIVGLDFFGTNKNMKKTFAKPEVYFGNANEPGYRYKTLFSYDTLKYSRRSYELYAAGKKEDYYDRENVKHLRQYTDKDKAEALKAVLKNYRDDIYAKYAYDETFKDALLNLKKHSPTATFIVFTTPEAEPLFALTTSGKRLADYERWLTDIVDVFGGVTDFTAPSSVTKNVYNFADGHHFEAAVGKLIAQKISGKSIQEADFGYYLTKENLAAHMSRIREEMNHP